MRTKNPEYFKFLENFIDYYIERNDRSPSQREIAAGTGMSLANVSRYLSYMREEGMIDFDGTRNIITRRMQKMNDDTISSPVVGTIACGTPIFAEQNIEEYIRLPASWFSKGEYYLLRTKGDSMTGIGIDDGDLVVIRYQEHAEPGEVIVALVDEESVTLKRYYPDDEARMIRLHPENELMDDIYVEPKKLRIQGVAVIVYTAPTATAARSICHTLPLTAHGHCPTKNEPA